jgi:putative hydrolase of the HAD superfamily
MGNAPPADAAAYHDTLRDMLFAIAGRPLPEVETEAVIARFPRYPGPIEPYSDVRPCLEACKLKGLRMGVMIGPSGVRARELFSALRLADLLPEIFGEKADEARAPATRAFESACVKLDATPDETAFVGDLFWSDVRAAGRAGLRGILLDRNDWWARVESTRIQSLTKLGEALAGLPDRPVQETPAHPDESPDPKSV